MNLLHPVWAEINLDNLDFNINSIKKKSGHSNIIGVVKANAYGHGAIEVSKALIKNGIQKIGVANIMEAIELRENGIDAPVIILGLSYEGAIEKILEYDIEVTVSTLAFANKLSSTAKKLGKVSKIHIALDTGMGRIGFNQSEESINDIAAIYAMNNIKVMSLFTHFSTADYKDKSYSELQLERYSWFQQELSKYNIDLGGKNVSNSAAIIDMPYCHYDYVRAGIIQYGYYPSQEVNKEALSLKPVLSWKTRIMHIKTLEANESVGYGRTFKTERRSIIGTIPVGYEDGYSRPLSNKAKVIVKGKFAPIIGNICMDQCMIDLTDIGEVSLYDEVTLLGYENDIKFDAEDFAHILNTINYEPLCNIGRRVPRVYLRNNEIVKIQHYI